MRPTEERVRSYGGCWYYRDRSVRVWLDPKDLNVAIKREHHPLLVVDDISTSHSGATLFSALDAEKAFCQI